MYTLRFKVIPYSRKLILLRTLLAFIFSCALVGCGGGGSSSRAAPPVSPPTDLSPGTPDGYYRTGGGFMGNLETDPDMEFSDGLNIRHRRLEGGPDDTDASLSLLLPPRDVRAAWRDGWTGEDANVLLLDEFGVEASDIMGVDDAHHRHGYSVAAAVLQIAPRASLYVLENGLGDDLGRRLPFGIDGVRRADTNMPAPDSTHARVINLSFGFDPGVDPPTEAEIETERTGNAELYDSLSDVNTRDAVIAKSGGNLSGPTDHVLDNVLLVRDPRTGPRTLIVGALNRFAQDGGARIASYSIRAGDDNAMRERFLVEYGGSPFDEDVYACDRAVLASAPCRDRQLVGRADLVGTSFSAPRVAGYAALVRHKFPNLSGAQTADILLDSATYEGLICFPSCEPGIYGQGRVDIGRALAPSGALR